MVKLNSASGNFALERDHDDPLREFRDRFQLPADGIYLDGNSLGPLAHATETHVIDVLRGQWGAQIVGGWNAGWIQVPRELGAKIAGLIGAEPAEVIVCDSASVNFYKLVVAAMNARPARTEVVTESDAFPTNDYLLQGCAGLDQVRYVRSPAEIESALNSKTAVLALNHVNYKSAWMHDAERLTKAAHDIGAVTLWDLSHSVGVVPIELNKWNVDLAVGCTYKYLNGGPGAPAFLYVRKELQERLRNPIQGWWGHQSPFSFRQEYESAVSIDRFLTGTPSILSMVAVDSSLDIVVEAGIGRIRQKSVALTEFVIALWSEKLAHLGITLNSPRAAANRGSHIAFGHERARAIVQCLAQEFNVMTDFRPPEIVRFGLSPLYNSFTDAFRAVELLAQVVAEQSYLRYAAPADPAP